MPPKAIIIRFSDNVDSSRELTAVATGIAFSFSDRFADRKSGARRLVVYVSAKHIWRVGLDKDTPLPPCTIQHRTVEAAMSCRTRVKGEAACHRWEIRGGDIVVARGAGPTGYERKGHAEGVEWSFARDYLTRKEQILITAYGETVIEVEQQGGDRPRLGIDQVAGMAIMLRSILRTRDTGWILDLMECRPQEPQQDQPEPPDDDLPANVVVGPWKARGKDT